MVPWDHFANKSNTFQHSLSLPLSLSHFLPFPPWVPISSYPRYQGTAIKGTLYFDIKSHFSLWKGRRKTQGKAYKKSTNHIQGASICILNLILNSFLLEFIFFHWHLHICKWLFRGCGLLVNLRPGICACQDNQTASRSNCAKISLFNY